MTQETFKEVLFTAFRAGRQPQQPVSHPWVFDALELALEAAAIMATIWAAGQVGDLIVLALRLAGVGWV